MGRPNLLLIIADQWRADALGFVAGGDPVHTPNLDALAARGRVLVEATSTYPVCSPCRAMLLSGTYPWVNGVPLNTNSLTGAMGVGLRRDIRCWSDVLADEGYQLGWIGKWHLDPPDEIDAVVGEGVREDGKVWDGWTPPEGRHGFGFWYSYGACDKHLEPHYWTAETPQTEPIRVQEWSPRHEAGVAIDFLDAAAAASRADGVPFGLVWSINPPHQPFDEVPDEYFAFTRDLSADDLLVRPNVPADPALREEAAEAARGYFAAIRGVDEQVGRVLDHLEATGLAEDTIVIFTSDHGMQLGSHGLMYKNVPYDESMRVPMIISWPGTLRPGTDDVLMGSAELAPTLLGLLGVDDVPAHMVGVDLAAHLRDEPDAVTPTESLYLRIDGAGAPGDARGLRTAERKLAVTELAGHRTVELWDREADRYERVEVAGERPDEVDALTDRLRTILTDLGDPKVGDLLGEGASKVG